MPKGNPVEFIRAINNRYTRVGNTVQLDDSIFDAFSRLRTSNPFTLFDSKQVWNDPDLPNDTENFPLFWDNQQTSGAGTSTAFNANRASTTLAVSANTAGARVRQTKQRFNYQPGKSQAIILTAIFSDTPKGVTKRFGYFDENNGLFFQNRDGQWSVVIRSTVSGAVTERIFVQSSWNVDKLDRTGLSQLRLNNLATQIFFIDFEWLGSGRVRFGLFTGGKPVYCHQVLNANVLNAVYMSTPNLPIRAEIVNDGTGAASGLELICATVLSEGGLEENGVIRSANLGADAANEIQANIAGITYAVCGIRLKPAYLSAMIKALSISIVETAGPAASFLWQLHLNPTLTTGLTYSDIPNSAIQFGVGLAAGDVIVNEGTVLNMGYIPGLIEGKSVLTPGALRLGALIDGTQDEIILSVTPLTANQDILGGLSWQEVW